MWFTARLIPRRWNTRRRISSLMNSPRRRSRACLQAPTRFRAQRAESRPPRVMRNYYRENLRRKRATGRVLFGVRLERSWSFSTVAALLKSRSVKCLEITQILAKLSECNIYNLSQDSIKKKVTVFGNLRYGFLDAGWWRLVMWRGLELEESISPLFTRYKSG